jgi:hypothetical protein
MVNALVTGSINSFSRDLFLKIFLRWYYRNIFNANFTSMLSQTFLGQKPLKKNPLFI